MGIVNPPISGTSSSLLNVTAITTTYTITSANDVVLASGAGGAYTITLPDATLSTSKKLFQVKRTDATIANIISFATVSSQTIDGSAASATTLNTANENYTFITDGSNWQILDHKCNTPWLNTGTITITGTTTNPTVGTVSPDSNWWRRVGSNMECRFEFKQTAAGTAGSGDYLFAIPNSVNGVTINTSVMTPFTAVGSVTSVTNAVGSILIGNSGGGGHGGVSVYDSTHVRLFAFGNGATNFLPIGSGWFALSGAVIDYAAVFTIPITGWRE